TPIRRHPDALMRWRAESRALQWSRRANATETDRRARQAVVGRRLQWSRRANATETLPTWRDPAGNLWASMEPSRERDGDELLFLTYYETYGELQWSRRANATETATRWPRP